MPWPSSFRLSASSEAGLDGRWLKQFADSDLAVQSNYSQSLRLASEFGSSSLLSSRFRNVLLERASGYTRT